MLENKEELKNKIIYRASYRGSKEMDILMTKFVKSIINNLNFEYGGSNFNTLFAQRKNLFSCYFKER